MAAYAALLSLSHLLHQIQHPPPLSRIIIDKEQIGFLQDKVCFVIHFLETFSCTRRSEEFADLEKNIADAAYAAEDIIEYNIVEQIRPSDEENFRNSLGDIVQSMQQYGPHREERSDIRCHSILLKGLKECMSMVIGRYEKNTEDVAFAPKDIPTLLCEGVQTVIEKFVSIERELMKIKDKKVMKEDVPIKSSTTATSSNPIPSDKLTMVGFDEHLNEVMGALATDESNRQIVPIMGMGGIGKTTLATAVYNRPFIVEHFQIRAWVTISQEYIVQEVLIRLLSEISKSGLDRDKHECSDDEIGDNLYKELFGRKYLIVMDDMWDIQAWDKVKRFLPDNGNGSRVLVTTRLSKLADDFGSCIPHRISLLNEEKSWGLLRVKVFGKEVCPIELEEIGRNIARKCRGLPLALVAVGGLLAKLERSREHWGSVEGDFTSPINCGNDEQLMEILSLSYSHLPIYLKPCFLYLSVFPEDFEIRATRLVKLWVSEGLIKTAHAKGLEEVAHEYLEDLIDRNLILVYKRGSNGKVRSCKIHDLLREVCITEAAKENFVYIAKLDNLNLSTNVEIMRRLHISSPGKPLGIEAAKALLLAKFNRSWFSHSYLLGNFGRASGFGWPSYITNLFAKAIHGFRLLKVARVEDYAIRVNISNLINLRYVDARSVDYISSMHLCWNLQTLIVRKGYLTILPIEIWQMPQLRHLKMYVGSTLRYPPPYDKNVIVLENLQTLQGIVDFKCSEEVVKRIPNLKKLRISYGEKVGDYCLKNLGCFKKLETLQVCGVKKLWWDVALPFSLKKLTIRNCRIPWEHFSNVGSLPNLEVLKLDPHSTKGLEWNPIEGEFPRLKFLLIWKCELKIWRADNIHFPCLETLVLGEMVNLKEIPKSFAEISTLQVIELYKVHGSIWKSAREISGEQEQQGYEPLQLRRHRG